MKVLSYVNQKGGVAKTTSCFNMGSCLAETGRTVLLIDLDSQGSLSVCAGIRAKADDVTIYEVLKGENPLDSIRQVSENLFIIPADMRLSGVDLEIAAYPERENLLRRSISPFKDAFDYVLIDCPTYLGLTVLNALTASDGVIVPVKVDYLALNGLSQLVDVINAVKKKMNPDLKIDGMIATFYNRIRRLDRQTVQQLETFFPGLLFETKITQNTDLAEAPSTGEAIFDYNKKSSGSQQYKAITEELIKREEG